MSEWVTTTVSEIADVFDGPHATPAKTVSGPWFLSISSLNSGRLVLDESAHLSEDDFDKWTRRVTPTEGDLLFSYETRLGEAALMPTGVRACLGRRIAILRPKPHKVDPRFLLYAYLAPEFQATISRRSVRGATVDRIPLTELPAWQIRLPSIGTQRAIAAVLGILDEKIAVNEQISGGLRKLMRFCFMQATEGSGVAAIGDIADVFDGPHATPKKTSSGPWFLSISSLRDGRLCLGESAHLSEEDYGRWTRRVTPIAGDLLFSYETRLGEAALMPPGVMACLGRRMALLRPKGGKVGPRTLLQAFLNERFQETIKQRAVHGATVDRIPLTELPSWPIVLPVQGDGALEERLGHLDTLANVKDRENEKLADLRDALLPGLMSGEIRVRDAEKVVEDVT